MSFELSEDFMIQLLEPTSRGEWEPFMKALDENVRWWISNDVENVKTATGVYVLKGLSFLTCAYQYLQTGEEWKIKVGVSNSRGK